MNSELYEYGEFGQKFIPTFYFIMEECVFIEHFGEDGLMDYDVSPHETEFNMWGEERVIITFHDRAEAVAFKMEYL